MATLTPRQEELLANLDRLWQSHASPAPSSSTYSKTPLTLKNYYASRAPQPALASAAPLPPAIASFYDRAAACKAASSAVLEHTQASLDLLQEMEDRHASVVALTGALYESFETLLHELDELEAKLKAMETPLPYFTRITALAKVLGGHIDYSSGANNGQVHVRPYTFGTIDPTSSSFADAIRTIDECTAYLEQHMEFKDTAMYMGAYTQLLANASQCLKDYAVASLESAKDQVISANAKQAAHADVFDPMSNYYVQFHVAAPACQAITNHFQQRATAPGTELYLAEVLDAYVSQRVALLLPAISASLGTLDASSSDIVHVLRVGCQYLVRLCQAEHQLFQHMFGAPPTASIFLPMQLQDDDNDGDEEPDDDAFQRLVLQLCYPLYQCVRPRLIKEQDLEVLCESIEVLRSEIMEAQIRPRGSLFGEDKVARAAGVGVATEVLEAAIERMVGDAQERLILCTQKFIRDEIEGFQPSPADLQYPEKLQAPSVYATWYPTLEHTLMCLSKVYRYLNRHIFEELAQEAVCICTASLKMASADITGPCDGGLFLIKHLLTLRERITPFDIQFAVTEKSLDFTSTTDAMGNMLSDAFSLSLENSLLGLITHGIPHVNTTTSDVKKDLEHELKRSCTTFIEFALQTLGGPLTLLLRKATATKPSKLPPLPAVASVLHDFIQHLQVQAPPLQQAIHNYLMHASTEAILFQPIQNGLVASTEQLKALLEQQYALADRVDCDAQIQVALAFILQL
ncbi:conserved oligomeric Golgi complex subunit [Achlya hypogyna]|uniref:Conserved oligomeric Golgi complex subunit 3 n=1 Tax=Achlya hypogyna TaxID=1202772 RepID=A0A1V9ZI49_ACHHY|nr:conserved oligomeric Golgi complex subunit [Achlya hypogyna]